ncbi:ASI1-immunoprecipitated protein 2-like [Cornus florida]|uniref:ASI1-immunoprecipitated protein 2-like n=1 Tax=Cornus florida TaxID=4283 RepID=UPI00289D1C5C|nr:ASI1-immunoprecipitated protein 2-like [Cornus florida]
MVDLQTVCCMCGDVGFPDKLFRCSKCHDRFQHSYCSNYYSESSEPIELCDWCQSEERSVRHGGSSKKSSLGTDRGVNSRSHYAGEKVKQRDREEGADKGKNPSGVPSPRPSTRRYKLLKDVMC